MAKNEQAIKVSIFLGRGRIIELRNQSWTDILLYCAWSASIKRVHVGTEERITATSKRLIPYVHILECD